MQYIHNGIDPKTFEYHNLNHKKIRKKIRKKYQIRSDELCFLTGGSMKKEKGYDLLLDCVSKLEFNRKIKIFIVGDITKNVDLKFFNKLKKIADGEDLAGGYGGPGSNSSAAPWESIAKMFQDDITAFVEDRDPGLKRYLPKMLIDYSGKEEELYKLLHREYSVPYIQPQYARKYSQAPITVAHDEDHDNSAGGAGSGRSPFRTKDETMLEMARREARAEIQTKLDRYGR